MGNMKEDFVSEERAVKTGYARIAGPVDRAHFLDEQARHRRASTRYAALCIALVLAMCLVMSVLLAPILYSIIGLALDAINIVVPMPNLLGAVWAAVEVAIDGLDKPGTLVRLLPLAAWGAIPGLVFLGALFFGLRRVFTRAGVHGLLAALPVRDPRPTDLEERQLVNVVEEMAIAAGVKPPRVMLTEAAGINCGAVGTSIDDAVVIVSRELLDRLDRDETQGVLGHLIASIGNGDMRIGLWMIGVMQMLSALSLVVNAPVNREARRQLWALLRVAFGRSSIAEAQFVAAILANPFHDKHSGSADDHTNKWVALINLPAQIVDLIFSKVFNLFVLSPVLGLAWRRRKYLADAAAVQLTRYPDGLARALDRARGERRSIPGGEWAAHLFVFDTRASVTHSERAEAAAAMAGPTPEITFGMLAQRFSAAFGEPAAPGSAAARAQDEYRKHIAAAIRSAQEDSGAGGLAGGIAYGMLPPTRRRIERLRAMGATVEMSAQPAVAGQWRLWVVLAPLFALLAVLVGVLFVAGTYLIAMLSMFVIALPVGALHALLHWISG